MQICGKRGTAGQDETAQRGKPCIHRVNLAFQPFHLDRHDAQRLPAEIAIGRCDVCAQIEHVILDRAQCREHVARRMNGRNADQTVRFVDVTDRCHQRR